MTETTLKTVPSNCELHGGYENKLEEQFLGDPLWSGCPRCQFDQLHSDDADTRAKAQAQRDHRSINAALLDSRIPLRFRPATLENYRVDFAAEQAAVLRRCEAYASDFLTNWKLGRSMLLLGTLGTGKTHLACAIIQHVLRAEAMAGAVARYTIASDIIRSVKQSFGSKEVSEGEVYARLHQPDLLVIDEIGVQHGSEFEQQVLFEVINGRYSRLLPTILISNLNLEQVRKFIGDRVIDRLCDAGGEVVLCRWPSVRGEV